MNCDEIQNALADYLGDELEASRRSALETHLESCDACRQEVSELKNTVQMLERLKAPSRDVLSPMSRRIGILQPLAYAAVLIIGIGIGWLARPAEVRETRPSVSPATFVTVAGGLRIHPEWVEAAVGSTSDKGAAPPFARNLATFARALSQTSRY